MTDENQQFAVRDAATATSRPPFEAGVITMPRFSDDQVRYLDERRHLATRVDESEPIGGCKERSAHPDVRRNS